MATDMNNKGCKSLDHILTELILNEGWCSYCFWNKGKVSNSGFPELNFRLDLSGVSGVCTVTP